MSCPVMSLYSVWVLGLVGGIIQSVFHENVQSRVLHGGVSLELALEVTEPTGETNLVDQTKPLEIRSVTFRLPPDHTVDATALFLSACPVKCNDPEV